MSLIVSRRRRREPATPSRTIPGARWTAAILRLGPEALESREPVLVAGILELADRLDAEGVVHCLGPLGSEPRDADHLDQAGGDRGLELFVVARPAGRHQLTDLLGQPLTDAFDLAQAPLASERREIALEPLDGAGRIHVSPALERVLALQLEESGDL